MKKLSVILFVFLFLIFCVLSNGCKKNESEEEQTPENWTIAGTWTVAIVFKNNSTMNWSLTFTGDNASGTCVDENGNSGVYKAGGTVVNWTRVISYTGVTQYYIGIINSDNNMSGTFIGTDSGSGTWTATR